MGRCRLVVGILFLLSLSSLTEPLNAAELLIKFPTRERTKKFFKCLDQYYKLLSKKHSYHFLISCDANDVKMNNAKVKERFKKYDNLTVIYGERVGKIGALYCLLVMICGLIHKIMMILLSSIWKKNFLTLMGF